MNEVNKATVAPKQLKKNDFLAAITEKPVTRQELVDSLAEYDFLSSWLDYLTEHFLAQGKIVRNGDGTLQRSTKKGGGNTGGVRTAFCVEETTNEDGSSSYAVVSKQLAAGEAIDKENGWAATHNRAVKNAVSAAHAKYMAVTTALKTLLKESE